MPNKIVAALQSIRKILREPFLINDYEEALKEERAYGDHFAKKAKGYYDYLQSYERAIALSKEIASQIYFDRELGLLQAFQYIDIDLQNRQPIFKMSHGEFTVEDFRKKLTIGLLEPMTQEQVAEKGQWPRSVESLKQVAAECSLEIWRNPELPPMVKIQGTALPMNNWQEAEDIIAAIKSQKVCGILAFGGGQDYSVYTDPRKYMQQYAEELNVMGAMGGVTALTLSKDPELLKGMDDIKWGYAGEENPYDLAYYQKKCDPAAVEDQEQQDEAAEPELEDEELEP